MLKDELAHAAIEQKLEVVIVQMQVRFDLVDEKLEGIETQTTKTNGRVTELENTVDFIKLLKKYKWLLILVLIGVYTIISSISLEDLKKLII